MSECSNELRGAGLAYPRTCALCGIGRCLFNRFSALIPSPVGMSVTAYICVSPGGNPVPETIRPSADESWRVLRASITEPDTLIDKGWEVHVVSCVVGGVVA